MASAKPRFRFFYAGVVLSDFFEVIPLSRPMPEFQAESIAIPGVDGEQFEGLTLGKRESVVRIVALDKDTIELQSAARRLMEVLSVLEPRKMIFTDEKDGDGNQLYRMAVPVGAFDMQQFIRAGYWDVRFVQHDPFLYGKERSIVVSGSRRVDAGGNTFVYPILTTNPSGSSYTFSNGTDHITYKAPFGGASLTIDMERQRCSLSSDVGGDGLEIGSRFFALKGAMTLHATSPTTVSWKERWL